MDGGIDVGDCVSARTRSVHPMLGAADLGGGPRRAAVSANWKCWTTHQPPD